MRVKFFTWPACFFSKSTAWNVLDFFWLELAVKFGENLGIDLGPRSLDQILIFRESWRKLRICNTVVDTFSVELVVYQGKFGVKGKQDQAGYQGIRWHTIRYPMWHDIPSPPVCWKRHLLQFQKLLTSVQWKALGLGRYIGLREITGGAKVWANQLKLKRFLLDLSLSCCIKKMTTFGKASICLIAGSPAFRKCLKRGVLAVAEEKVITVAFKSDTACTHKFKLTLQLGECAFCCAFCLQPHLLILKSEAVYQLPAERSFPLLSLGFLSQWTSHFFW